MKKLSSWNGVYAVLLFLVFFFAGNGILGLTHPDEVFYTQTAQEMIQHKTLVVPYLFDGPNFEKPIFSYWLFILGFKLFGVSSFSARFFPAVFAVLGILGVYFLGKTAFRDEKKGLYAALVLMSSLLYVGLARTVFTDMFFTVLIELSLVFFYWGYAVPAKKTWGILLFWLFAGFAVLTKGILGLCIPFAVIILFLAVKKELRFILNLPFLLGLGLFLAISVPWYAFMIKTFGQSFINEFFYNDHVRRIVEAEHVTNDRWFFYPVSMVVLMAPWSLFVVWAMAGLVKRIDPRFDPIYLFLVCWLLVVFTVFQCAHSKLVSYIFPLFPAMALATGDLIARIIENPKSRKWFMMSALVFPVVVLAATVVAWKMYEQYIPYKETILQLLAVYFFVVIAVAAFIWRKDGRFVRMAIVMAQIPLLLAVILSIHHVFEDYATSKNPSGYLLSKYEGDAPLISSRMYIRAVRFFTQKKVVWLDLNDKKFFSPHPIEKLTDSGGVQRFLGKYRAVYGILNKKDMKQLQGMVIETHVVQVLSVFGDEYVVKVNPVSQKIL